MKIAVIGAGHAGVEAAASARQAGAEVVLFSSESVLPYFRPRLPGVAFGQLEPGAITMRPQEWYDARGIELRLEAAVTSIVPRERCVVSRAGSEKFDALVLAWGSVPRLPPVEGLVDGVPNFTLWSMDDALRIRKFVAPGQRLVVVGGGILGLEAALRGREAGMQVTVIECLPQLMPMQFGEAAAGVIRATLEQRGLRILTGTRVLGVAGQGIGVALQLADGATLEADMVLFATGAQPQVNLAREAGIETVRGICVDAFLQTGCAGIFASGDVAQVGGQVQCSARSAAAQGKLAGANAAATASGRTLQAHHLQPYPVFFKSPEIELYVIGRTAGGPLTEERLDDAQDPLRYRCVVKDGTETVGVQMVGTREGFDALSCEVSVSRTPSSS
jgi:NAD(P)H-nitrite reductase large subunit